MDRLIGKETRLCEVKQTAPVQVSCKKELKDSNLGLSHLSVCIIPGD